MNCFQKLLSSWHDTTLKVFDFVPAELWIAFKNYYLRDTTQQEILSNDKTIRCELLSKIIIFVTRHNLVNKKAVTGLVVNCFQKLLSSWHDTTFSTLLQWNFLLWIAFKNYYLRDTTQLLKISQCLWVRCELLSKIIIFVTRHNIRLCFPSRNAVVNCFQKLLSSWHDTTKLWLIIEQM